MKLLLATTNDNKKSEIQSFFHGGNLEILTLSDLNLTPAEETGNSFVVNARIKAKAAVEATGLWSLGEDSGLEVDGLNGAPGIHSARFAGEGATDAARIEKLLEEMAHLVEDERNAGFRSCMVLAGPSGKLHVVDGRCRGQILFQPRGTGGFGYDPVFFVPALNKTFAELTIEEKMMYSHRGMALRNLKNLLDKLGFLTYD